MQGQLGHVIQNSNGDPLKINMKHILDMIIFHLVGIKILAYIAIKEK